MKTVWERHAWSSSPYQAEYSSWGISISPGPWGTCGASTLQVWAGQLAWMRNKSYEQNHWCPGVNLLAGHNLDDMAKAAAMGKW